MSPEVRLGRLTVGADHPPVLVAELSANHRGSLETALALVDAAAAAGAHAVKLQTYTADTITLDVDRPEFRIEDPESLWDGRTLHELYAEGELPWEWHAPIVQRCAERGLEWFSSPFDPTAVDRLETLGPVAYKIASFELVDLPLIRHAAATGRPLVLSTGMATAEEVDAAVGAAREAGCAELVLLQCTSAYPAGPETANLRTIPALAARHGCPVGLSDHTLGLAVPLAAVALGASLVEKHLTLDRAAGGLDAGFSLEPAELATLVTEAGRAWRALGRARLGPLPAERTGLRHRRSLYVTRDLRAGDVLDRGNLRSIRPADGLPPAALDGLLGRRVVRDVPRGTPMRRDLVGD